MRSRVRTLWREPPRTAAVNLRSLRRGVLVAPGFLSPRLTRSRSQPSLSRSTAISADGATWVTFPADQPRFNGTARRLLVEGQRTNSVRNPRCEGSSAGSPGTPPTHWQMEGGGLGITQTIVGTGTENGINYIEIRWNGTASAPLQGWVVPEVTAGANGQTWASSMFGRLVAGSFTGCTPILAVAERAGGTPTASTSVAFAPSGASLGTQRGAVSRTFNQAGTTQASLDFYLQIASGVPMDVTLRLGWPQLEQGQMASTPILPATGTPAASTRGGDFLSVPLATIGISGSGLGVYLTRVLIPSGPEANQMWPAVVDDGTVNNNYAPIVVQNTNVIAITRATAGVQNSLSHAPFAFGTIFNYGMAVDGAGRVAGCFNGAAPTARTGGPTSGLTTLRVGGSPTSSQIFGEIERFRVIPRAVSDAELQALVAAL